MIETQKINCYQCGVSCDFIDGNVFCSPECKEKWQSENYKNVGKVKRSRTVKELREGLLKLGESAPKATIEDQAEDVFSN